MKRVPFYAVVLMAASFCAAQGAPAAQSAPTTGASSGEASAIRGTFAASLGKSIDSKKLKEGDEVPAKTVSTMRTGDGIMIPGGSKIIGHVTQAKARSKGDSESSLGITFDKIEVSGGKQIPINGTLQAVGPNPSESSGPNTGAAGGNNMNAGGQGGYGEMSGPASTTDSMRLEQQAGQKGGGKILTPKSTGVVGIKNLQLDNSVLTSTGKEVKLDMGSQLMIKSQ